MKKLLALLLLSLTAASFACVRLVIEFDGAYGNVLNGNDLLYPYDDPKDPNQYFSEYPYIPYLGEEAWIYSYESNDVYLPPPHRTYWIPNTDFYVTLVRPGRILPPIICATAWEIAESGAPAPPDDLSE